MQFSSASFTRVSGWAHQPRMPTSYRGRGPEKLWPGGPASTGPSPATGGRRWLWLPPRPCINAKAGEPALHIWWKGQSRAARSAGTTKSYFVRW